MLFEVLGIFQDIVYHLLVLEELIGLERTGGVNVKQIMNDPPYLYFL